MSKLRRPRVIFQADYQVLSSQYAGCVLALQQGFYQRAGLDVTLRGTVRAGTEPDIVAALQEELSVGAKKTVLALGTAEQNVVVPAQYGGTPVIAVSAMLQSSPLCLAVRSSKLKTMANFNSKSKIGTLADSLTLTQALFAQRKISPRVVEVYNRDKVQLLIDGEVDAIQVYDTTETIELEEKLREPPKLLRIGNGLGYAQVVFGHREVLTKSQDHRDVANVFLRQTYRGWKAAARDPEAAAKAIVEAREKAGISEGAIMDSVDFQHKSLENILAYVINKKQPTAIGTIDKETWADATGFMAKAGVIRERPKLSESLDCSLWLGFGRQGGQEED